VKGTLYSVTILMSSQSSPSVICLQFGLSENDLVPLTPTSFPICADRRVFMRPGSRRVHPVIGACSVNATAAEFLRFVRTVRTT